MSTDFGGALHPGLRFDAAQPFGDGWDLAAVLHDVLFPDVAHGHLFAARIDDGDAENAFGLEDPFGVVAQSPVAEIREALLGGIKLAVDWKIVLSCASEQFGG